MTLPGSPQDESVRMADTIARVTNGLLIRALTCSHSDR